MEKFLEELVALCRKHDVGICAHEDEPCVVVYELKEEGRAINLTVVSSSGMVKY